MIEKVLIVDDEPLATESLKRKLHDLDDALNIQTETVPANAIDIIREWSPHLLFLDIAMPEISGFDLLDQLDDSHQNFVLVFCTAYSEYAIDAFEKSAIDYLVKPVEPERLVMTLEKVRRATTGGWIEQHRNSQKYIQKVVCTMGRKKQWLPVSEISWLSSENHETVVHDKEGIEYFCPLSLAALENRLDPASFFRCHRSHVINRAYIRGFSSEENQLILTPYPNTPIPISRRLKQDFKKFLGV